MCLCDYGCGQEAHYFMKNGKACCSSNVAKCPAIQKKLKENHADSKQVYKNLPQETKDKMKWNKGKTKETDIRIYEQAKRTREKYQRGELKGTFTFGINIMLSIFLYD